MLCARRYRSSCALMFQYSGVRGTVVTFEGDDMAVVQIHDIRGDAQRTRPRNTKARKFAAGYLGHVLAKVAHVPSDVCDVIMGYLEVVRRAGVKMSTRGVNVELWAPKSYYTFPVAALKKISRIELGIPRPLESKDRSFGQFHNLTDYRPIEDHETKLFRKIPPFVRRSRGCHVCPAVRMTSPQFTCKDCIAFAALEKKRERKHKRRVVLATTYFREFPVG